MDLDLYVSITNKNGRKGIAAISFLVSNALYLNKIILDSELYHINVRLQVQTLHDVVLVALDGTHTYEKAVGYLLVAHVDSSHTDNLDVTLRESLNARLLLHHFLVLYLLKVLAEQHVRYGLAVEVVAATQRVYRLEQLCAAGIGIEESLGS